MIGTMDQRVTLQRLTETPDGIGGVTRSWINLGVVWASVRTKAASEGMEQGRMNASAVSTFWIWNRSDLTEVDRLMWGGEVYNIRGVLRQGGRRLRLQIEAERGVAS